MSKWLIVILSLSLIYCNGPQAKEQAIASPAPPTEIELIELQKTTQIIKEFSYQGDLMPSDFLKKIGLNPNKRKALFKVIPKEFKPTRWKKGIEIQTINWPNGDFFSLRFKTPGNFTYHYFFYENNQWNYESARVKLTEDVLEYSILIDENLWKDMVDDADIPPQVVTLFTDLFAWDVDFHHQLRQGDTIALQIAHRHYETGEDRYGPILAAGFKQAKRRLDVFYYPDTPYRGHFHQNGKAVKKQFLRAPLKFARITSGYKSKRFHPILKRNRPHLALDYGAPKGTPIMTTASGRIKARGRTKGRGNYFEITHNNGYSTLYYHLSGFASNTRKGRYVTQGQTIGYVGSTGLATANHLHYVVKHRGKTINPRRLPKSPDRSLPKKLLLKQQKIWQHSESRLAVLLKSLSQNGIDNNP